MESLDQLQKVVAGLYSYCAEQSRNVQRYRSWRTGLTLNDLMGKLSRLQRHDMGYLIAWVFTNGDHQRPGGDADKLPL